ncbi:MAG: type I restriction endonuclease, partial [Bacteroidota bacterium]
MDLIDRIQDLALRTSKLKDQVQTEEATKNAFIMPFLTALGYDVFNPTEVIPEFVADIGIKKGEKVDYCVLLNGQPAIIIEAKHWKEELDVHSSQLHRYFHVTTAKFGIL